MKVHVQRYHPLSTDVIVQVVADPGETVPTPVKVNIIDLQLLAHNHWQEQMNAWLVEFEELNKKR